jgi:hypothetical protein
LVALTGALSAMVLTASATHIQVLEAEIVLAFHPN